MASYLGTWKWKQEAKALDPMEARADYIEGIITRNPSLNYKLNRDSIDFIAQIKGNWTEQLSIDGEVYWHIDDYQGFKLRVPRSKSDDPVGYKAFLMPSDCRHRDDLIEWRKGDET